MFTEEMRKAGVTFARGFRAAGVKAGIKKSGNLDLALICSEQPAVVAATFTKNQVAAAPVVVSREIVKAGKPIRAIVANAGCANACTGDAGLADARAAMSAAAKAVGCQADEVLMASTGVIGVRLPMSKVVDGISRAAKELSPAGSVNAGNAIITTDTYSKSCATRFVLGGKEVRMGAIAKGSGMIRPDMATMLCFITTDAAIERGLLRRALSGVVETTFNMISVDGDMSTNDMVVVMANGEAGNAVLDNEASDDYRAFRDALLAMCTGLSERIAADGEGASKFLTVKVTGARSFAEAKQVGMSVANSPLVKTAFFGEDPNWGRVICAVGYAGVPIAPEKTVVRFGDVAVYAHGLGAAFDADRLRDVMAEKDIVIGVELGLGEAAATVWTCDFSYEYVKINGEYHT